MIALSWSFSVVTSMEAKVCPACNSMDISADGLFKFEQRCGLSREICSNCGYSGPMTVMERKGAERLKVIRPKRR